MLQTEHARRTYALPTFASARTPDERRRRQYAGVIASLSQMLRQLLTQEDPWTMRDSGQSELDAFLAANEDARDELAYRKLTGQSLDAREELILAALNQQLDQLLAPHVSKEQHDFVAALEEAKRLLAKSK